MKRKYFVGLVTVLVLASLLAACGPQPTECPPCPEAGECPECPECPEAPAAAAAGERLAIELVGFGYLNPEGEFEGFDVDYCKALAAAVFGDPNAVEYRPLTASERLPALQTGEIDVLIRNTTWTLTRDAENDLNWAGINFYDGQGMMVRKESGFETLEDMEGATICSTTGTTTEMNLADAFRSRGVEYTPLLFESTQDTNTAYEEGRCDGETSEHAILNVTMSKEPLGPLTAHGADEWNDVVRWVLWGILQAEESGVTSQNVDEVSGEMGTSLGIPDDFMVHVLKAVGNYAEIYDRWCGPVSGAVRGGGNLASVQGVNQTSVE
jgi:general L-amino acid transport system substrate-binding protein